MSDSCEICSKQPATTGVREVKLCQTCFDAISAGTDPESYARFTALVEAKAPAAQQRAEQRAQCLQEAEKIRQQPPGNAVAEGASAGAFVGVVAGLAAHYLAGGKMTFPIFIVAYILILSGLKGRGKLVGLVVFSAVAALVVVVFQHLEPK